MLNNSMINIKSKSFKNKKIASRQFITLTTSLSLLL